MDWSEEMLEEEKSMPVLNDAKLPGKDYYTTDISEAKCLGTISSSQGHHASANTSQQFQAFAIIKPLKECFK